MVHGNASVCSRMLTRALCVLDVAMRAQNGHVRGLSVWTQCGPLP